jgi:hypothetical protein
MRRRIVLLVGLLVVGLLGVSVALAQSGGTFTLAWFTADGGGGASTGGAYAVSGALGQPDAGAMGGGGFTLAGGFWQGVGDGAPVPPGAIYLPVVLRSQ